MRVLQRDPGLALPPGETSSRRPALVAPGGSWERVETRWNLARVITASTADVEGCDRVTIVQPTGALPDPLPPLLADRLGQLIVERPVIVDLTGVATSSAAPLIGLAEWLVGAKPPGQSCVVCAGPLRPLLREARSARCFVVFGSIGDALQARLFAHDGYGRGWHPDPHPR